MTVPEPEATEPSPAVTERNPEATQHEPEATAPEPEVTEPESEGYESKTGFWTRLWRKRKAEPLPVVEPVQEVTEPEPEREPEPVPDPEPAALAPERVQEILNGTLDALGQAHHRPFSRG